MKNKRTILVGWTDQWSDWQGVPTNTPGVIMQKSRQWWLLLFVQKTHTKIYDRFLVSHKANTSSFTLKNWQEEEEKHNDMVLTRENIFTIGLGPRPFRVLGYIVWDLILCHTEHLIRYWRRGIFLMQTYTRFGLHKAWIYRKLTQTHTHECEKMHPQRVQSKSPFTCAIKFSTQTHGHTPCVSFVLMLLLLLFQFLALSYGKTVCLNAARKTALFQSRWMNIIRAILIAENS